MTNQRLILVFTMLISITGCGKEQVDAYYYPDRNDLTAHQVFENVGAFEACVDMVYAAAALNNDPDMQRGDYECGIGPTGDMFGPVKIYRVTRK